MSLHPALLLGAITVLGASCAVQPATSVVEEHLCGSWLCGGNSPTIAGIGDFYDLNLDHLPNARGFQITSFTNNGYTWAPHVYGGRFTATRAASPPLVVTESGQGLVGGQLWLLHAPTGRQFAVLFTAVGSVTSWSRLASGPVVLESYQLDYSELINGSLGHFEPLCSNAPSDDSPDLLGMNRFQTLFFEGDRINDSTKNEAAVINNSWFNLGCAGHLLAKLALTGHTEAARNSGAFVTTRAERITMLKMLAADYCGNGMAFTVTGQLLRWADNHGTMSFNGPGLPYVSPGMMSLEARWNEHGAVCLHKPRVDANPTVLAYSEFQIPIPNPDIYSVIQTNCLVSDCADLDVTNNDGYHLISATPR